MASTMELGRPFLVSRLVAGRHPRCKHHKKEPRKGPYNCYRLRKNSAGKDILYLQNEILNPRQKCCTVYIPARFHSSKSTQTSKSNKTLDPKAEATSWSSVYNAVETVGSSIHKKVVDGVFSPLLVYSTQMMPKLSARDHKVLSDKLSDQDQLIRNTNHNRDDKKLGEKETKLPHVMSSSARERIQFQEKENDVHFDNVSAGEKSASYWVQMPSLKQYVSAAALSEMSASASRVLRRKKKFEDVSLSGDQHIEKISDELGNVGKEQQKDISRTLSTSPAATEDIVNPNAARRLEDDGQQGDLKTTSIISGNIPFATDILKKAPSSSSDTFIFKKFRVLPSSKPSSAASSSPSSNSEFEEDHDTHGSEAILDDFDRPPSRVEYTSSSHTRKVQDSTVELVERGEHTPPPGTTSYIYNNYNLKYIQVNLSNPITMFQTKKKEKPVATAQTIEDSTTYFDSDCPLVEMTEALNSKDTSLTSSAVNGNSHTVVADKSKKYTEVAGKIKDEKAKQKAAEEKSAKKVIRPAISKANIDARTKSLAIGITVATNNASRLLKLERLCNHLMQYPESRHVAIQEKLIPTLLKLKQRSKDATLLGQVHQMLAQLGYAPAVKGRGIRILSVDGGGSRGVIAIEILRELERQSGQPIHQMFDYVIGVSSGAVLAYLLAYAKASLDTCEQLFKELSVEVFQRNTLLGTSKLFFSHAYYDTDAWMAILKNYMQVHGIGQRPAIEISQDPTCPKVASVANLMNAGVVKNFLFRNYNPPPNTSSYLGSSKYQLCESLRASSAAPGYFEEYKIDDYVFQDGGVLTNNPSALGVHESKLLWPDTPIQCLVSLGTGRYDPVEEGSAAEYSSLKKKLYQFMISATDTEAVHTTLQDLLPDGSYFRFNPRMTEDFLLDENRPDKIDQLQLEARDFVGVNELRLMQAAGVLTREKSPMHRARDWVKHQRDIYQY